jgi:hypothetical protein
MNPFSATVPRPDAKRGPRGVASTIVNVGLFADDGSGYRALMVRLLKIFQSGSNAEVLEVLRLLLVVEGKAVPEAQQAPHHITKFVMQCGDDCVAKAKVAQQRDSPGGPNRADPEGGLEWEGDKYLSADQLASGDSREGVRPSMNTRFAPRSGALTGKSLR